MPNVDDKVVAEIQYLKPNPLYDNERPYSIATVLLPGVKRTNIEQAAVRTPISSVRGKEDSFALYVQGFEWTRHDLNYELSIDTNVDRYMEEMGSFLRKHLNASEVIVYDYVFREQRESNQPRAPGVPRKVKKQILGAHLDISRESALTRIRYKCGERTEELIKKRWHIVNIWRPLNGPVKSMPLALCDSRSLAPDDAIASDIVLPHLQIQAYEIWYNPDQRWHYLKDQTTNEVTLMLSSDSDTDTRCAHTAFEDPNTKPTDPKRNSIELRCMVFL
ncbi:uncharacterized protein BDZ99DRAFT_572558 [Mytilinidion resinicola]|uniref:Methyltransferase n=1 Tax=Mytilinidion resinicola TaxID=574789 RepID=A0A6A6YI22_9PEZI|nr:uncharacterized protein BDZ99DRAFT_572558 [Mytilinidion resinicola]KAF2807644.1 hypothetical protein BDZ99DRAFT_572558 [Mytilinidion resinicola]